ncbi:Rap1a/Tai family immunity protein [Agaribacterium haliotis]|uniref:Rap1a/Tai family immunity protein n=1 Tax=Agaribacterium haliotis TaxID=2013869 RepID=UPI000BB557D3|nr:Rap1a/Tai family immunity protein [Agaribacterium haliotis]
MRIIALIATLLAASPGFAIEAMDSNKLKQLCSKEKASECQAYIQGYLGGALASERAAFETERSKFEERAMRTRLGSKRAVNQNSLLQYCLATDSSIETLTKSFQQYLTETKDMPDEANKLLSTFLKSEFPCNEK